MFAHAIRAGFLFKVERSLLHDKVIATTKKSIAGYDRMADATLPRARRKSRQRLLTIDADANERHASWLELFFDLVFVLAVAQVAKILAGSSDVGGFLKYAALFVPVWWSWIGFTFHADRFESDETEYRVMTFAAMLAVAALSLTLGGAFTPAGDTAFVSCYALVRLVLIAQYTRTAMNVPMARGLAGQYIVGFGASLLILLASLLFEPPLRYYIWAAALLLELATPFLSQKLSRVIPYDHTHIPERFGLFTIIVLGEAVVATANGAAGVPWNLATIGTASLGFAMGACIWWINFEFVEDSAIKSRSLLPRFVYLYGHFFIVSSIVAIGIGVEHAIKEVSEAQLHMPTLILLGGGVAVYLTAITTIRLVSNIRRLVFMRIASIAASLLVLYFGQFTPPVPTITALYLILGAAVWLEGRFAEEKVIDESPRIEPCEHSELATVFEPRSADGCEQCIKNNYKMGTFAAVSGMRSRRLLRFVSA